MSDKIDTVPKVAHDLALQKGTNSDVVLPPELKPLLKQLVRVQYDFYAIVADIAKILYSYNILEYRVTTYDDAKRNSGLMNALTLMIQDSSNKDKATSGQYGGFVISDWVSYSMLNIHYYTTV